VGALAVVLGVVFYDLVARGYAAAFGRSLAAMGALLLAVTALTLTLPRQQA
jgi:hypothetical protein